MAAPIPRASHRAKNLTASVAAALPRMSLPIPAPWAARAAELGYILRARVLDRFQLLLQCQRCEGFLVTAKFTLMRHQPRCGSCIERERITVAAEAGLTLLRRDDAAHQYGLFQAPCGHLLRRQFARIPAMLRKEQLARCEICLVAQECREAAAHGWQRVGPDPEGYANYRLYRHRCGTEQRIAVANMRRRCCSCAGCDPGWSASPSHLYAMAFTLPDGTEVTKLGYARDPAARLQYQLRRRSDLPCSLLLVVPMPNGHHANIVEKGLHRRLRQHYPDQVIDPVRYSGVLRVTSEIYAATLTPVILELLEAQRGLPP